MQLRGPISNGIQAYGLICFSLTPAIWIKFVRVKVIVFIVVEGKRRESDDHSFLDVDSVVGDIFVVLSLNFYDWRTHAENFVNGVIKVRKIRDHVVINLFLF